MKAIADIGGGSGCWPSDQSSWYYSSSKQRSKENLFYPVNCQPREEPSTCRGSYYSSYSSKPSAFSTSSSSTFTSTASFTSCRSPSAYSSSSSSASTSSSSSSSSSSVSRSLFGASDPRESRRLERDEFRSQRLGDSSRWNFDFHKEKPIAGRYDWCKVGPGKQDRSGSKSPSSLFSSEENYGSWSSSSSKSRSPDIKKKFY